jgi:hypothetical protein
MKRFWSFLAGALVGALLLYAAMTFHVVRSSDGFMLIAKSPPRLSETIVDIRAFTLNDWASRPQLAGALVQSGNQHLLGESAANAIRGGLNQLLPEAPRQ